MQEKILELASLVLDLGRVDRKTSHQDGEYPESDTDHTVMLGILAATLGSKLYKDLNIGRVTEFALVHDLVEAYVGDTPTLLGVGEEFFKEKEAREAAALEKIKATFGDMMPWVHETIEAYERLDTKEARFVKVLDKIIPKLTIVLNKGKGFAKHEALTKAGIKETYDLQNEKLKKLAFDMPELLSLYNHFVSENLSLIN